MAIHKLPTQLNQAEYERTIWSITPPSETKIEDILKQEYWTHVSRYFKAGDRIEVIPEDRHYFLELFVLGASKKWAKVVAIRKVEIFDNKSKKADKDGFKVEFVPAHKWRVTRTTDGNREVISKGHEDQVAAETWLKEHKKEI